jgi:DNA-binding response OmpR family regulator
MPSERLQGVKVLVVEDDPLIAMLLEDMLAKVGAIQIGSARTVDEGLSMVGAGEADLAILDVNLHGRSSKPIAEALAAIGVPVVYATGYGAATVLDGDAVGVIVLEKPFTEDEVMRALSAAMAKSLPRSV